MKLKWFLLRILQWPCESVTVTGFHVHQCNMPSTSLKYSCTETGGNHWSAYILLIKYKFNFQSHVFELGPLLIVLIVGSASRSYHYILKGLFFTSVQENQGHANLFEMPPYGIHSDFSKKISLLLPICQAGILWVRE